MQAPWIIHAALALAGSLTMACGESSNPVGPSTSPATPNALLSVSPSGGATQVSQTGPLTMRFSAPMMAGMEQYVDFHEGDAGGPLLPLTCTWSGNRTILTCTPNTALQPNSTYTLHMGAGMVGANGSAVDMGAGTHMGGQWLTGGMMGGMHAGQPMSMMGGDWKGANGSYGMLFTFVTG
jgi:hypothetical protein